MLSSLAVRDDVTRGQLTRVAVEGLDLRRSLRAVWIGDRQPPAGAARDLVGHITSYQASLAPAAARR